MNQRSTLNKQEGQPKDTSDDAGLDFMLNAAIESNPFQKKRIAASNTEKAPTTQPIGTTATRTYPSYTTAQKPIETPQTKPTTYGYQRTQATEVPKTEQATINQPTNIAQPERPPLTSTTLGSSTQQQSNIQPSKTEPPKFGTTSYSRPVINKESTPSQPEAPSNPTITTTTVDRPGISTGTNLQANKPEPPKTYVPPPYNKPPVNKEISTPTQPAQLEKTSTTTGIANPNIQKGEDVQQTTKTELPPPKTTVPPPSYGRVPPRTTTVPQPTQPEKTSTTTGIANPNIQKGEDVQQTSKSELPPPKTTIPPFGRAPVQSTVPHPEKPGIGGISPGIPPSTQKEQVPVRKAESEKVAPSPSTINKFTPPDLTKKSTELPKPAMPQTRSYTSPVKDNLDSISKQFLKKMETTPKKLFASFNNNRGFMLLNLKEGSRVTTDLHTNYLGHLLQSSLSYPGPYKFDKKTLEEKKPEIMRFFEKKLHEPNIDFIYKLSLKMLNEYLSHNTTNFFVSVSDIPRERIADELYNNIVEVTLKNLTKEYTQFFQFSDAFLKEANNLSYKDNSWEDVLFKSLFLRNSSFNVDSVNLDFIINYVKSRFAPGDLIYTVAMVKLELFHEIFESQFFTDNNINEIWPLLIYPCLKYYNFIPVQHVKDFLNSFALKILEHPTSHHSGFLALFIAILSGEFDVETFGIVGQKCKNAGASQILETYYFAMKNGNVNFDKNYDNIGKILPLLLKYAGLLIDFGLYERAKEYIDYIVSLRPFYQNLEGNTKFMSEIKVLRNLIINYYTIIEETKNAQKQQTNLNELISTKKEEINQMATNTIKSIQAKSKGLFGFMSGALSKVMNANEQNQTSEKKPFEEKRQAAEPPTMPTRDSLFSTKPEPTQQETLPPTQNEPKVEPIAISTQMYQMEDQDSGEPPKIDYSKQGKNLVSNPFGPVSKEGSQGNSGVVPKKQIIKNRYVSPF